MQVASQAQTGPRPTRRMLLLKNLVQAFTRHQEPSAQELAHARFLSFLDARRIRHETRDGCVHIYGDLVIHIFENITLPDPLFVHGSLRIESPDITRLPETLTVKKDLYVFDVPLAELPATLSVGRNITLALTRVRTLPDNLRVRGSLDVRYCPIHELPPGLDVAGNLSLENTDITHFPADLRVKGTLHPPHVLQDVMDFMQHRPRRVVLDTHSGHQRMELMQEMQAYPDLTRVIASHPPGTRFEIEAHATTPPQCRMRVNNS